MGTALVLSGGGARGAFQVGAVRYLYEQDIRPDIICGTSVGAINGAKLAEGEGAADQGLRGLDSLWLNLRENADMWLEEPWLNEIDRGFKDLLTGEPGAAPGLPDWSEWGDLEPILYAVGGMFVLPDLIEKLRVFQAKLAENASLYNLNPILWKLSGSPAHGVPRQLHPERVVTWSQGGARKLRIAIVCLEDGRLRYVTETGAVLERDGSPMLVRANQCRPIEESLADIATRTRSLQRQLSTVPPGAKPELIQQIRELNAEAGRLRAELAQCQANAPQVPAQVSLAAGVLASASIPAIFKPVQLPGGTYVDGGVRDILPIGAAVELGGDPIYAVMASADGAPAKAGARYAGILDIAVRSLLDVLVDEVGYSDAHPAGGWGGRSVFLIAPTFDLYDIKAINPGLIRIAIDYGYLRAADVLTQQDSAGRAEAFATSDALTRTRYENWELEGVMLAGEGPSRDEARARAVEGKAVVKSLLERRRAANLPVPTYADDWWRNWEWHPATPSTSFDVDVPPVGSLDDVSPRPEGLRIAGWAIDPNTTESIEVRATVDGAAHGSAVANISRPDVAAAYPRFGALHGFDFLMSVPSGRHRICVQAVNIGSEGGTVELGCRDVEVRADPFGWLDDASGGVRSVRLRGWAIDPNSTRPIDVHVYVGGTMAAAATANLPRPDVAAAHPGYGEAHGFDLQVPAAVGRISVRVFAINVGAGTTNPEIGSRDVTVPVPTECVPIQSRVTTLKARLAGLQRDLSAAPPGEKPEIMMQIAELQPQVTAAEAQLRQCLQG
jgi:NTE family protein